MADSGFLNVDPEESEAVAKDLVTALVARHQALADIIAGTSDFQGAADDAGKRAQELARAAKTGLDGFRLAGAASVVGTARKVLSGVAMIRDTDFENKLGLKAVGERIDGTSA